MTRRLLIAANLIAVGFLAGIGFTLARAVAVAAPPTCMAAPTMPDGSLVMLYDGQRENGTSNIGLAASVDDGRTWARAGCPVFARGSAGSWDDSQVYAPQLARAEGWVMLYGGFDGQTYRIGRATSPDLLTWTRRGVVLDVGPAGSPDERQATAPQLLYEPDRSPAWKLWYTGEDRLGLYRLMYADSDDGIAWRKRGVVLEPSEAFDRYGVSSGTTVRVGEEYRVFYAGQAGLRSLTRPGLAVTTDPANPAAYRKLGPLPVLSGELAFGDDVYDTNGLTKVVPWGGGWMAYGAAIGPESLTHGAIAYRAFSPDLVTWSEPEGPLLPLVKGAWDGWGAANPAVAVR